MAANGITSVVKMFKNRRAHDNNRAKTTINDTENGLIVVQNRYAFYRDQYRLVLKIVFIESCTLVAALIIILVMVVRPIQERFFATTIDGQMIPLIPLDVPNLETAALLTWASRAVVETLTYGFHDRRLRHQAVHKYFTKDGWVSFLKALEDARVIEMVEKQQLVVSAIPERTPVIIEEGQRQGIYFWIVHLPLLVTYQGPGKHSCDHLLVKLYIVRTSVLEGEGLGIQQWIATPAV